MQQMRPFSITAPGFAGLNTQDAPVDMDGRFALEADNCVIDKYGRVGSRKGWVPSHSANGSLGSSYIESIGELIEGDGTRTIIAAGNNKIFKMSSGVLVELIYGGGGAAPTITANNWQMCVLNGAILLFQSGHDPLIYIPAVSTGQYRRVSEVVGYTGTIPLGNCGISAFGRIWTAVTTTDKNTVTWSDTLTYNKWTAGSSGTLNLHGVWPQGGDEIVALAQHNNFLIIFGAKQILIYSGANNPASMALADSISSTGCIGRDTVQNTGQDLIFLSDTGVRSISRTIQEKSAPLNNISRNVNSDIQTFIGAEINRSNIKSVYSPIDSFYLLVFIGSSAAYCFDMLQMLPDGSARVTTWSGGIIPRAAFYSESRKLYFGQAGRIGEYSGYYDNGVSYRMGYYSSWLDFSDPVRTSILKKILMTIYGAQNQSVVYKWGFDYISATDSEVVTLETQGSVAEYGTGEYGIAEYESTVIIQNPSVNTTGSGKVIQVGVEVQLVGNPISVQRIDLYTKDGRY